MGEVTGCPRTTGSETTALSVGAATGIGAGAISEGLQQAVIKEIVERARLERKCRGRMPMNLLGKEYEVTVEEYDSFGESAFNLTVKRRTKRTK